MLAVVWMASAKLVGVNPIGHRSIHGNVFPDMGMPRDRETVGIHSASNPPPPPLLRFIEFGITVGNSIEASSYASDS